MKKLTPIIKIVCLFSSLTLLAACQPKPDKSLRKDVLSLHDKMMNEDGEAMSCKMALKSLATDSAIALGHQLDTLSSHMMDWMHQFKPDDSTRSAKQADAYYAGQKIRLVKMDSTYQALIKRSDNYLKAHHRHAVGKMPGMKMKM